MKKVYCVETVQLFFDFLLEQTRLKKEIFWLGLLKITEIFREITSDYYAFIYVLYFFFLMIDFKYYFVLEHIYMASKSNLQNNVH